MTFAHYGSTVYRGNPLEYFVLDETTGGGPFRTRRLNNT